MVKCNMIIRIPCKIYTKYKPLKSFIPGNHPTKYEVYQFAQIVIEFPETAQSHHEQIQKRTQISKFNLE